MSGLLGFLGLGMVGYGITMLWGWYATLIYVGVFFFISAVAIDEGGGA